MSYSPPIIAYSQMDPAARDFIPMAARFNNVRSKPLNPAAVPFVPMEATVRAAAPKKGLNPAAAPFDPMGAARNDAALKKALNPAAAPFVPMGAAFNGAAPKKAPVCVDLKEIALKEDIKFVYKVVDGKMTLTTTRAREPWRLCDNPASYDPSDAKQAASIRCREFGLALMAGDRAAKPKLEPTVEEVHSDSD